MFTNHINTVESFADVTVVNRKLTDITHKKLASKTGIEKRPVRGKRDTNAETKGTRRLQNLKGMTANANI